MHIPIWRYCRVVRSDNYSTTYIYNIYQRLKLYSSGLYKLLLNAVIIVRLCKAAWHWSAGRWRWSTCGPSAASSIVSAERWSARSTRHHGWAVGRCFFPLDVSKLVIPFLICIPSVVGSEWMVGLGCLLYQALVVCWPCHWLVGSGRVGRRRMLGDYHWLGQVKKWWPEIEIEGEREHCCDVWWRNSCGPIWCMDQRPERGSFAMGRWRTENVWR